MQRRDFIKANGIIVGSTMLGITTNISAKNITSQTTSIDLSDPTQINIIDGNDNLIKLDKNNQTTWSGKEMSVAMQQIGNATAFDLSASKNKVKKVIVLWKYLQKNQEKYLIDHLERSYGDLQWQGVPYRMPWYFMIYDGKTTQGYGVKTGCNAIVTWTISPEGWLEMVLDVRSGIQGVNLGGRTLRMAEVITRQGLTNESPFQAQRAFCKILCEQPLKHPVPIYGANDWYYCYGNNSEEKLVWGSEVASTLAGGLSNRPFSVVDAGWQKMGGCEGGPWNICNERFKGMDRLAEKIKKTGCKPGIWYRPLLTEEIHPQTWLRKPKILDPTVPEVLEKIKNEIKQFKNWGYELVKHDFTTFDIFDLWGFEMRSDWYKDQTCVFQDNTKTTAEVILDLYRAIREAASDTVILGCNTLSHLAAGLVEIQRIGDDTSGNDWERTRRMGVNTLAFRMAHHETFYQADGDCLGLTTKIPWKLNQQWLKLLAESGTPVFVSSQPDALGEEQKKAIREAYQIAAQAMPESQYGEPLDWMENHLPQNWKLRGKKVKFNWY